MSSLIGKRIKTKGERLIRKTGNCAFILRFYVAICILSSRFKKNAPYFRGIPVVFQPHKLLRDRSFIILKMVDPSLALL